MAGLEYEDDKVLTITPESAGGGAARPAFQLPRSVSNFFKHLRPDFNRRTPAKPQLPLTSTTQRLTAAQQLRPQAKKDEYEFTVEDDAPCQPRFATAPRPHAADSNPEGNQHRFNRPSLATPSSSTARYSRTNSENERQNGVRVRKGHIGQIGHIERDGQRTASTSGREEVTPSSHRSKLTTAVQLNGAAAEITRTLEVLQTPKAATDRVQVDSSGKPDRKVPAVTYARGALKAAAKPSSPSCVELSSEEEDFYESEKQHAHTKPAPSARPVTRQSERSLKGVSERSFYRNTCIQPPVSLHRDEMPKPQECYRMAAPTADISERHPKKAKPTEPPLAAFDLSNWQPAVLKDEVVYPTNHPDAVTVSNADMERLAPSEFLNDTLIDFYIKYMQSELPKDQRARIHFFNSFFYKKLTQIDKDGQSGGAVGYARVRNWTRKTDIFTKDYIIVPINESLHWSVAIICHPNAASQADGSCAQGPSMPFIVHLDSMKGGHNKVDQYICEYLAAAWNERAPQQASTNPFTKLPVLRPKVPQQDNYSDCGLFLLYYVERFCKDVVAFDATMADQAAINSMLESDWFLPQEASAMRWELQYVLLDLDAQRHKTERPSPPVIRKLLQDFKVQAAQERAEAAAQAEAAINLVTPPPTAADDLACQEGFKNLSLNAEEIGKTLPCDQSDLKQSPVTPPEKQEQNMDVLHPITNLTRELNEAQEQGRPLPQLQQMREGCLEAIRPSQGQVEKLRKLMLAKQGAVAGQFTPSDRLLKQQGPAHSHADNPEGVVVNLDDEGTAVAILQREYPLRSKSSKLGSMKRKQSQISFPL